MEHAAFFYQHGAMVPVLRRHRTFRKDGTGRIQHYPQRFHPLFVIVSSLGTTNSSLVSNLVGAGQRKGVFPICHKIIKMGYAIGLPLVGIALLCNYWIIRFYTNNETLVQHTVPLSSLCCLIMYSQCPDMFTSVLSLEPERQKLPLSFKWLPLWYIFFIFTGWATVYMHL